ncbi:copper resistance CopC family protein [Agreia sp. COWG]|uniref:copper resistance CopC family protein n=1 Tax=Agreia sp. COWG TaxID=2773266 RepID=UPI00192584EC|nr:copper resistance CopC family protein [Agreia sp. COWG]CAD6005667.1 CopC domain-containing protein [Agreia sp. COWG]
MKTRTSIRYSVALVALTIVAVLFGAAPTATAHDALASSTPAADETVATAIDQVQLNFNEAPLAGFDAGIAIAVLDPAGTDISTGNVVVDGATLTKSITPTTAGSYQVLWQTVSVDGHPISGQYAYTYTVEPAPLPATTTPQETSTPSPTPATSTSTSTAAPADVPLDSDDVYARIFPVALLGGIVVVLIVVAIAIIVSVRGRRRQDEKPTR